MSRRYIYTTTALIVSGMLAYFLFFAESDEEAINRRLDELAAVLSISNEDASGNRLFKAAGTARRAGSDATEDTSIQLTYLIPVSSNQRQLVQILTHIIHAVDKSTVSFEKRVIKVSPSRETALVELESLASGWKNDRERKTNNSYTMQWVKIDGHWLIAKAEILRR